MDGKNTGMNLPSSNSRQYKSSAVHCKDQTYPSSSRYYPCSYCYLFQNSGSNHLELFRRASLLSQSSRRRGSYMLVNGNCQRHDERQLTGFQSKLTPKHIATGHTFQYQSVPVDPHHHPQPHPKHLPASHTHTNYEHRRPIK